MFTGLVIIINVFDSWITVLYNLKKKKKKLSRQCGSFSWQAKCDLI